MLKIALALVLLGHASGAPSTKKHVPSLDGRIVGGRDADVADYPYQLSVLYDTVYSCGGALISPKWAITAGHCVDDVQAKHVFVRAGSSRQDSGGEVIQASNVFLQPKYNDNNIDYDIALIELSSRVTIANAAAVGLPEPNAPIPVGAVGVVTGWGALSESGNHPDVLQVVEVPVVSQEDCKTAYSRYEITDRMFCAGFLATGGKDACQGDSGSPLVVKGVLTGVVSWGQGCAEPNKPGVYTNVYVLRSWIQEVTGL